MMCVYIAVSPSNKIYVGKTVCFHDRWQRHAREAKDGSRLPFHAAIRKYGIDKFKVTKIPCVENGLNLWERLLIAVFRSVGKTYNVTSGGEGIDWKSPEFRSKMLAIMRSPEWRAKQSEKMKALWAEPKFRAKMISSLKDSHSRERRNQASIVMKALWRDPLHRRKVAAGQAPEFCAKQKARGKARWQDPEYRAKKIAAAIAQWQDPKYRESMVAKTKERWETSSLHLWQKSRRERTLRGD